MRKLMISTIIIMPLLLLTIMLVSGAIMSLITHIYVESIEFPDDSAIILVMNDQANPPTYNLGKEITILPIKASNKDLVYSTSSDGIIRVSDDGVITPIFYGETYITVKSKENKAATATRKVIITDTSVHVIKMGAYEQEMYEGESQRLAVKIYPDEAENKAVDWSSSNPGVLQVSANGTVTAVGGGTATITAKSQDDTNGEVKAEATITCFAKLDDVIFDRTLFVTSQKSVQFPELSLQPIDCYVTKTYSSSNTDIAEVNADGLITFKKEGKVSISVKVTDYNGAAIELSKEFVSTFGYFVGPLFTEKEITYESWDESEPIQFARNLDGAFQEITNIECFVDGFSGDWLDEDYMKENLEIRFEGGVLPECDTNIQIKIQAKVYNFTTNSIETYEDCFLISKTPSEVPTKVTQDGQELSTNSQEPTPIKFNNIGDKITLQVEDLNELSIQAEANAYINVEITDGAIVLTSRAVCSGQKVYISVGTKTYVIEVSVQAKAEGINVFCEGQQLTQNGEYKTLLDELSFMVKPTRSDGQQIRGEKVLYKINDASDWQEALVENGEIAINMDGVASLAFKCDEQEISFDIKKASIEDFGMELYVTTSNGKVSLGTVASVRENAKLSYNLPSNVQNNISIKLLLGGEFLGGVGSRDKFVELSLMQRVGVQITTFTQRKLLFRLPQKRTPLTKLSNLARKHFVLAFNC